MQCRCDWSATVRLLSLLSVIDGGAGGAAGKPGNPCGGPAATAGRRLAGAAARCVADAGYCNALQSKDVCGKAKGTGWRESNHANRGVCWLNGRCAHRARLVLKNTPQLDDDDKNVLISAMVVLLCCPFIVTRKRGD